MLAFAVLICSAWLCRSKRNSFILMGQQVIFPCLNLNEFKCVDSYKFTSHKCIDIFIYTAGTFLVLVELCF